MSTHIDNPLPARRSWAGPRAVGLVLLAIGVIALLATVAVPSARDGWAVSGPRFFPLVASLALIVCSAAFLIRTFVRPDADLLAHAAQEAEQTEWRVVAAVAVALLGYVITLEPLGYILATALFFPIAARVLGSRSADRDLTTGIWVAVVTAFVFTQLLGVRLPTGLLGF